MFEEYPDAVGFLSAIREAPDDVTTRLVFADWLDERGDPRAAWLREETLWEWMRPDCRDPVPGLLASLTQPGVDYLKQQTADKLLHWLGVQAIDAVRARTAEDIYLWWTTRYMIEQVRPPVLRPVPELLAALSGSWGVAILAVTDLGFHGHAARAAAPILLNYRHPELQDLDGDPMPAAVYRTLGLLGNTAAIPLLWDALDWNEKNAEAAAEALCTLGPLAPNELLGFFHLGENRGDWPLEVLTQAHPEGLAVLARLLRRDPDLWRGPEGAARVIANHPEAAAPLVPVLLEALQYPVVNRDHQLRDEVVSALAKIGAPASSAIPALQALLDEYANAPPEQHTQGTRNMCLKLAAALVCVGAVATGLPYLRARLHAADPGLRATSAGLLGQVGCLPELVPDLLAALDDPAPYVRHSAIYALAEHLAEPIDYLLVVPALLTTLAAADPTMRSGTASALGRIFAQPTLSEAVRVQVVQALLGAANDLVYAVHSAALGALRHGPLPAFVVAPLLALLQEHGDAEPTFLVLAQVCDWSPEHRVALREFLTDSRPGVAYHAGRLLAALER